MCIRDSAGAVHRPGAGHAGRGAAGADAGDGRGAGVALHLCLLYTSDAADERSSVDLGGRRIIKKKNKRTDDPR